MTNLLYYFLLFLIYSILGWIVEMIYIYIVDKEWVNRGVLLGPYCPIYGVAAVVMVFYLSQYKNNVLTVFILATVLCTLLEYFTSYLMEKIFNARWWDYSDRKFNIDGRVCGENAILFGFASIITLYVINPSITYFLNNIHIYVLVSISVACLLTFITDCIISYNTINRLRDSINSLKNRDSTQEIKKMIKIQLNKNNKRLQHRIINAFPGINLDYFINKKKRNIFTSWFKKNKKN